MDTVYRRKNRYLMNAKLPYTFPVENLGAEIPVFLTFLRRFCACEGVMEWSEGREGMDTELKINELSKNRDIAYIYRSGLAQVWRRFGAHLATPWHSFGAARTGEAPCPLSEKMLKFTNLWSLNNLPSTTERVSISLWIKARLRKTVKLYVSPKK